jgi:glucose-6-phosphate 1-dehydrogenase
MRRPPRSVFDETMPEPCNYVRFRLGPDVTTAIGMRSKAPGEQMVGDSIELSPTTRRAARMGPYERLLSDAMRGDPLLFATQEAVEAAWRIVDPILGDVTPLYEYDPGTWGPPEVDKLIVPPIGWRNPQPAGAPPPPGAQLPAAMTPSPPPARS